jgi:hypothetical protein
VVSEVKPRPGRCEGSTTRPGRSSDRPLDDNIRPPRLRDGRPGSTRRTQSKRAAAEIPSRSLTCDCLAVAEVALEWAWCGFRKGNAVGFPPVRCDERCDRRCSVTTRRDGGAAGRRSGCCRRRSPGARPRGLRAMAATATNASRITTAARASSVRRSSNRRRMASARRFATSAAIATVAAVRRTSATTKVTAVAGTAATRRRTAVNGSSQRPGVGWCGCTGQRCVTQSR